MDANLADVPASLTAELVNLKDELVNIAMMHFAGGDYPVALTLFARALEIYKKQFGPEHARTRAIRDIYNLTFDRAATI
jgi:hypothetical protein